MINSEHDENIRVNIRTGTSSRAPCPRNSEINNISNFGIEELQIEIRPTGSTYQNLLSLMYLANINRLQDDAIDRVLRRSMDDSELHRDSTICLNINQHSCKTTELDSNCSVCQNTFKLGDILSTLQDCSHTFHHSCLQEWGKYKQECPLCRKAIPILER